jgi:hypothetical protein
VRTWPAASYHGPRANLYDGDALIKIAIVNTPPPYIAPPNPCAGPHPAAKCSPMPNPRASAHALDPEVVAAATAAGRILISLDRGPGDIRR